MSLDDDDKRNIFTWIKNSKDFNPDFKILSTIKDCIDFYDLSLNKEEIETLAFEFHILEKDNLI